MEPIALSCRCGATRGQLINHKPGRSNRSVCYCKDCRAFLRSVGRDDLLDAHGGSDIIHVAPAQVKLEGSPALTCTRLSPKGMFRFSTTCCQSPIGNLISGKMPFVGLSASVFAPGVADRVFGSPNTFNEEGALNGPVPSSKWQHARTIARVGMLMAGWKLRGMVSPSVYFANDGSVPWPTRVLSKEERAAVTD